MQYFFGNQYFFILSKTTLFVWSAGKGGKYQIWGRFQDRNSGERMSGRERTGADFYPSHVPLTFSLTGAPKIQAASVEKIDPFLTPF